MGKLKDQIKEILRGHSAFRQVIDNGLVTKEFDDLINEAKQEFPSRNQLIQLRGYLASVYEGHHDEESQKYYLELIDKLIRFVKWFGNESINSL